MTVMAEDYRRGPGRAPDIAESIATARAGLDHARDRLDKPRTDLRGRVVRSNTNKLAGLPDPSDHTITREEYHRTRGTEMLTYAELYAAQGEPPLDDDDPPEPDDDDVRATNEPEEIGQ